jgi:hypothetical protein
LPGAALAAAPNRLHRTTPVARLSREQMIALANRTDSILVADGATFPDCQRARTGWR